MLFSIQPTPAAGEAAVVKVTTVAWEDWQGPARADEVALFPVEVAGNNNAALPDAGEPPKPDTQSFFSLT